MKNNFGWISINRKVTNHWVWTDKPFCRFGAWVDILLECNYEPEKQVIKGVLVETGRGQSSNSLKTWASRWGWSVDKARRFLRTLESDGMVAIENIGVTTRLTVCNYDDYQNNQNTEKTQKKRTQDADETQKKRRPNTNNNDNNHNNENNVNKNSLGEVKQRLANTALIVTNMGIQRLLAKVYDDHGANALEHIIVLMEGFGDHGKVNRPGYLRRVIENTDFDAIKKKEPTIKRQIAGIDYAYD